MARITKSPDQRREELMDNAQTLFSKLGFERTSVSAIVKMTGVAQGTFYYYFKTKDDILEAVVTRLLFALKDEILARSRQTGGSAPEKLQILLTVLTTISREEKLFVEQLYQRKYIYLLDMLDQKLKEVFTPPLIEIIRQGQQERTMRVTYPEETVAVLLHNITAFIDLLYGREEAEVSRRTAFILQGVLENLLNMKQGSLNLRDSIT